MFSREERRAAAVARAAYDASLTEEQRDGLVQASGWRSPVVLADAWLMVLEDPDLEDEEAAALAAVERQFARLTGLRLTQDVALDYVEQEREELGELTSDVQHMTESAAAIARAMGEEFSGVFPSSVVIGAGRGWYIHRYPDGPTYALFTQHATYALGVEPMTARRLAVAIDYERMRMGTCLTGRAAAHGISWPYFRLESGAVYAVCPGCAHVEPRPAAATDDWQRCESCGERVPLCYDELDAAEEASEMIMDTTGGGA